MLRRRRREKDSNYLSDFKIIKNKNFNHEDVYLLDFKVNKNEILQNEKFIKLCNSLNIVFIKLNNFLSKREINNDYLFFHMGDEAFNKNKLLKVNNKFKKIYTVNCEVIHENIISIPLGVTDTSWCSLIGDLDIIEEFNKTEKKYKNLAYINFNTDRRDKGLPDRLLIKKLFKDKNWTTDSKFQRDKEGHRKFIDNIYNHKFVFCPRGNGVDTHRLWMSLYLGTIPIVKDHITYRQFKHLPIVFINDWSEINEEFLQNKFDEIHSKKYDMSILKMSFWENYINHFQ